MMPPMPMTGMWTADVTCQTACSAIGFTAGPLKPPLPRESTGFGLAVKIHVEDKSLPQAELAAFAKEAHEQICPYSNATRGNVNVQLDVVGG